MTHNLDPVPARSYRALSAQSREQAVQEVRGVLGAGASSLQAAVRAVAPAWGVHENTLRNWVRAAGITSESAQVARLRSDLERAQALAAQLRREHGYDGGA